MELKLAANSNPHRRSIKEKSCRLRVVLPLFTGEFSFPDRTNYPHRTRGFLSAKVNKETFFNKTAFE